MDNIKFKGKIIWADDEIDLLRPHILYLENKGYDVTSVASGEDAIHLCEEEEFDLVLLDEMMTGLDGLTTLKHIKETNPALPIIMITKNEEEWLMEEAIASQITNYLTKPVNPSQILMACKNALEMQKIQENKVAESFLKEFKDIEASIAAAASIKDWISISDSFSNWTHRFDVLGDQGLGGLLEEQKIDANHRFSIFVEDNFKSWIKGSTDSPIMSQKVMDSFVKPRLQNGEQVLFILIDSLRADQWKTISSLLYPTYKIQTDYHISLLPTATPYSRNAIFSGLLPNELQQRYKKQWQAMESDESSMNRFEEEFLSEYLKRSGLENKSMNYTKIITHIEGNKFANRINDLKNVDLLALVVNFVDILGHSRSESILLKEMIPDESAYRRAVSNWFEDSWLMEVLEIIKNWGLTVVITSDHGSIRVQKAAQIKADKSTSTGIRYKHGRNLNISPKIALNIKHPAEYGLPDTDHHANYIIAKDMHYFLYPNNYNRYVRRYQHSFQHGGISMDEMILPVGILTKK